MQHPFLALDLGNSRLKVHRFDVAGSDPVFVGAEDPDHATLDPLALVTAGSIRAAGLASVGGERAEHIAARFAAALEIDVPINPAHGLQLDVRHPETVGFDRLYAARGAAARVGGGAIVVDVGTALTVDAVRHADGPDGRGAIFLGGAIAPGPALLASALADGTAQLPRIDPESEVPALGRETREAVASGVAVGLAGAARELVARISAETELEDAPVVLTGGARAFVREVLSQGGRRVIEEPALVAYGLRAACGDLE
jgi:pantothenate kinase type III